MFGWGLGFFEELRTESKLKLGSPAHEALPELWGWCAGSGLSVGLCTATLCTQELYLMLLAEAMDNDISHWT